MIMVSGDNSAGWVSSGSKFLNDNPLNVESRLMGLSPTSGDDELAFKGGPIDSGCGLLAVEGR
jgi:hypothetical protein